MTQPAYTDADVETVANSVAGTLGMDEFASPSVVARRVLDALTAAGWRPKRKAGERTKKLSRSEVSSLGAKAKWAQTGDRTAATAAARQAFHDRWEKRVDPDGELDSDERARRAAAAKSAYFADMARRSRGGRQKLEEPA